ncbi:hypothetical protein PV10_04875 [Exophiala mesophila]|uniref:Uncharacterized protein n=1 Tax=Exophiala mesophila TaxID=212818 RepID=A0A0D1WWC4_EXOME|nr:uncharacterized protein PV10_04875 [Exophiala mesophila]KIV93680.1 hypothetical protein PV10_04875 [Exophiala mesophila]
MYFSSPTSNITPASTSVAMSRSDSRDTTYCNANTYSYAATSAYLALSNASPNSQPLMRSDSSSSSTASPLFSATTMRRDSSNSSWLPSPYRSCLSSFGAEPSSYLSDDDLLCSADELSLPVETIPTPTPKKELTTEEQVAMLRELQEKEAAYHHHHHSAHQSESRRKVVRFAGPTEGSSRRSSTVKRRQTSVRKGLNHLNGPQ